jgi:2-polyprenyl-6-methoxyphenol hydroxylase-like FAD-dependent oxidoreductase
MSTHFLQAPAVARLSRWGLLDRIIDSDCPPINDLLLEVDGQDMPVPFEGSDLIPALFAPRRTVLDKILVDAAREAGAEVKEGFYVEELVQEDGRVTGVTGRTGDGERVTEHAKVVIGADGRHSVVAEKAGAAFVERVEPVSCGYYGYFTGDFPERTEFRIKPDHLQISFPTHQAQVIIAQWPPDMFKTVRKNPEEHLRQAWAGSEVGDALSSAKLTEKVLGSADIPNFVRQSWGPGWALAGDAVYQKDPAPADGINDAYRGAENLTKALDDGLSGRVEMEEALAGYAQTIEDARKRTLPLTIQVSSFTEPPPVKFQAFMELTAWHAEDQMAIEAGVHA